MSNEKISALSSGTYSADLIFPAVDLTLGSGSQNVKVIGSQIVAAVLAEAGGVTSSIIVFQVKVATTSTVVQFPSHAFSNGFTVKASTDNSSGGVFIGTSSGVTTTDDGTGNGFKLNPGDSVSVSLSNSNLLYINSLTAGDFVYILGN